MDFFAGIEAKLIGLGLIAALFAGVFMWGHHNGAAGVQAKWDAANIVQNVNATNASETARATEHQRATDFAGIESSYLQATTHAYPSIADALPAAVAAGAVRLRDVCPAPDRGDVSAATARSRAADAAATAALAQRVTDQIAAVRAGDAADKREADFRALIVSLRALLTVERKP